MKKIIDGQIVELGSDTRISYEDIISRSHGGDANGWQSIHLVNDTYYLQTDSNRDYYAPKKNIEVIGDYISFVNYVSKNQEWAMDEKIISHIEEN